MSKTIPLTQGYLATVDDEDFERVNQFRWFAYVDKIGLKIRDEFTFRLNEGNVERHTLERLDSFVDGVSGKRLTYARLIA